MLAILQALSEEQSNAGDVADEASVVVTLELVNGTKVSGLLQVVDAETTSIKRFIAGEYADIARHYATSAIIGAYYSKES